MFTYAYGYKTHSAALTALYDMFADGTVSPGERPQIGSYKTKDGATRWRILLPM
jgi:hypothetical protein